MTTTHTPNDALFNRAHRRDLTAGPVRTTPIDCVRYPQEACIYGDDTRATVDKWPDGRRWITIAGPEGEVTLDADSWVAVMKACSIVVEGVGL